jgi:hypothetical protein
VTRVFSVGAADGQAALDWLVLSVVVVIFAAATTAVTDVAIQVLSTTCVTAYINKCPSTRASVRQPRPEREEKFGKLVTIKKMRLFFFRSRKWKKK